MFATFMLHVSIPGFHLDPTQFAHVGVHGEVYFYMILHVPFLVAYLSTNFAPVGLYPLWKSTVVFNVVFYVLLNGVIMQEPNTIAFLYCGLQRNSFLESWHHRNTLNELKVIDQILDVICVCACCEIVIVDINITVELLRICP